jgi:hypothetical protein
MLALPSILTPLPEIVNVLVPAPPLASLIVYASPVVGAAGIVTVYAEEVVAAI